MAGASTPIIKRYTYPFDSTGEATSNLITKEYHVITAQNRSPQNVIIPGYAPYFRSTLKIKDRSNGEILREGVDYTCEWPIMAKRADGTIDTSQPYYPVWLGIQFIDDRLVGEFELTYQTIGGAHALDGVAVAQALANAANDPLTTTYDQILGKPISFPPLGHVHHVDELTGLGFSDVVQSLIDIKDVLIANAREEKESHPGYETLIEEYFRLIDLVRNLSIKTSDGDNAINERINVMDTTFKDDLKRLKQTIDNEVKVKLNEASQDRQAIRASIQNLNQSLTTFINNSFDAFKREVTSSFSSVKQDIQNKDTALKQLITRTRGELETDFNGKINELKRSTTARLDSLTTDIGNKDRDLRALIERAKSELNGKIDNAKSSLINTINEKDKYNVKTTNVNQNIDGYKKFKQTLEAKTYVAREFGSNGDYTTVDQTGTLARRNNSGTPYSHIQVGNNRNITISGDNVLVGRDTTFQFKTTNSDYDQIYSSIGGATVNFYRNKNLTVMNVNDVSFNQNSTSGASRTAVFKVSLSGDHGHRIYSGSDYLEFKNLGGGDRYLYTSLPEFKNINHNFRIKKQGLYLDGDSVQLLSNRWGTDNHEIILHATTKGFWQRFYITENAFVFRREGNRNSTLTLQTGSGDVNIWGADEGGSRVIAFDRIAFNDMYLRSDARVKKDIKPITNALDIVKHLNGYTYTLTAGDNADKPSAGVIAQEVEKVLPDLVGKNNESGLLSINGFGLQAYLIEAIKTLSQQNQSLQSKLDELEHRLAKAGL